MKYIFSICLLSILIIATASLSMAEGPKSDQQGFQQKVAPLLKNYCIECHGEQEPEGKLSLHNIDSNIISGRNFETWRMVAEHIQFNEMPPKDADQMKPAQRQMMLAWIRQEFLKTQLPNVVTQKKLLLPQFGNYVDHQALFNTPASHVTPAPPRIWRLRPSIYKVIAPKLGEGVKNLSNGLNQAEGSDFKDYATAYFLDEASTLQLFSNAKKIAEAQLSPKSKERLFKQLVSETGAPTKKTVYDAIALAFRKAIGRGPTKEESQRFMKLYQKSVKIGGNKSAAKTLLTGILMQPEMLFRQELGQGIRDKHGRIRLSPREISYALSFALSNQPLDEFIKAAAAEKLVTSEQVAALVQERLKDGTINHDKNPRIIQFFREYFNYPFANEVFKDKPVEGEHDANKLIEDLEMTINEILKKDEQVLAELLTTRKFYVNTKYGRKKEAGKLIKRDQKTRKYQTAFSLPLDWKWSSHLQPVKFPKDERAGVLTHPAWLTAWSGNFDNHPVQRGKWIRTHLLGGSVPDVPIGVDARVPEKEHTTFRSRLKIATSAAECWRCHKKMDPIGLAFERYDHYGRYQRLDAGKPVVATGQITHTGIASLDGKHVSGPTELMELLAKSEYVEQVFVRHVFRFFMGRNETLGDAKTLQDAHRAYRVNNGSFKALITSILSSDSFLYRQPAQSIRRIKKPKKRKY